jgi:hypothetical protein
MRHALIALAALTAGSALALPSFALNPQPLPPGRYLPNQDKATLAEPPDPCRGVQGVAHIRCVQRHQRLYRPGNNKVPRAGGQ